MIRKINMKYSYYSNNRSMGLTLDDDYEYTIINNSLNCKISEYSYLSNYIMIDNLLNGDNLKLLVLFDDIIEFKDMDGNIVKTNENDRFLLFLNLIDNYKSLYRYNIYDTDINDILNDIDQDILNEFFNSNVKYICENNSTPMKLEKFMNLYNKISGDLITNDKPNIILERVIPLFKIYTNHLQNKLIISIEMNNMIK